MIADSTLPYNERVLLSDFDYELPEDRIAQVPLTDRAASRMLVIDRASGSWEDRRFRDFAGLPAKRRSPGSQQFARDSRRDCSGVERESMRRHRRATSAGLSKSCC